jgi:hypothetical protein
VEINSPATLFCWAACKLSAAYSKVPVNMLDVVVGLVVSVVVFAGGLVGMWLYTFLPPQHQTTETRDIVRLAIGMISILASLVLGLLTASAKQTFDNADNHLRAYSADIIMLDATMRDYGPATDGPRVVLRQYTEKAVSSTWPDKWWASPQQLEDPESGLMLDHIVEAVVALRPGNDRELSLRSQSLQLAEELVRSRWTLLVNQTGSISPVLIVIMVVWVSMIFMSFGLFAPRNATVVTAFLICSLSIGTSIFVILEMDSPFDGVIMVSDTAMRTALAHLRS